MKTKYFTPLSEQRAELRRLWNGTQTDWEEFLVKAEDFNDAYIDCYPNQGNAPIELIIKTILK